MLKRRSGKRIDVYGGVRALPACLSVADVEGRTTKRGTLDQSRTAVSDQHVDSFEQSDEFRSLEMFDRCQLGLTNCFSDSITARVEIRREHQSATGLTDDVDDLI